MRILTVLSLKNKVIDIVLASYSFPSCGKLVMKKVTYLVACDTSMQHFVSKI